MRLPEGRMFCAAFVSAAAPNVPHDDYVDHALIEDAIYNTISGAALEHHGKTYGPKEGRPAQHRVLVVGAWGCGAFKNNPDMIAQRFIEVLRRNRAEIAFFWDEIHFPSPTS